MQKDCKAKSSLASALLALFTCGLSWAGGVVTSCTEASLDAALEGGGLVTFQCVGTVTVTSTKIITTDTTLVGASNKVTLSGGSSNRIFIINSNVSLTLNGLTIINGACLGATGKAGTDGGNGGDGEDALGGAVLNDRGVFTAVGTTFTTNRAVGGAGGKGSDGVLGSRAGGKGGRGGSARGGVIFNRDGQVYLTNCVLLANSAEAGSGGGGGSGQPGQDGGNGADGGAAGGGAIYSSSGGQLHLNGCTLKGNGVAGAKGGQGGPDGGGLTYSGSIGGAGSGTGGGILNDGGEVYLDRCSFEANTAAAADGLDRTGGGGTEELRGGGGAPGSGGAVASEGGELRATTCRFTNNAVIGGSGGNGATGGLGQNGGDGGDGGAANGAAINQTGNGTSWLEDCTFSDNGARGARGGTGGLDGGFLTSDGRNGSAGTASGGAILSDSRETVVLRCTFDGNSVEGAEGRPGLAAAGSSEGTKGSSGGSGTGGAIACRSGSLAVTNATIYANTATGGIGGAGGDGGSDGFGGDGGDGGTGGSAGGGGIYNAGGNVILVNCTLSTNHVNGGLGGAGGKAGTDLTRAGGQGSNGPSYGGAFANDSGSATLKSTVVAYTPATGNVSGPVTDGGYNLSSDDTPAFTQSTSRKQIDPLLLPLADNGGPTQTVALATTNSPATDQGDAAACPPTDQRAYLRVGVCDIGAFEFGGAPPALSIDRQSGGVVISWPWVDVNYRLQSSVSLVPASWKAEATPSVVGNQLVVTNTLSDTNRFYQLER